MELPPSSYEGKQSHELPPIEGRSSKRSKRNLSERGEDQAEKVSRAKRKSVETQNEGEPPKKKFFSKAVTLAIAGGVAVGGAISLWKLIASQGTQRRVLVSESGHKEIDYGKVFSNYKTIPRREKVAFLSDVEEIIPQLEFTQIQTFLSDIPPALRRESMIKNFALHILSQVCLREKENPSLIPFLNQLQRSCPEFLPDDPLLFCARVYSESQAAVPSILLADLMRDDLQPDVARGVLDILLDSKNSIAMEIPAVKQLLNSCTLLPYQLLEARKFQATNTILLSELIQICPDEKRELALKNTLLALCKAGKYQQADNLVKTLLPNIEHRRAPSSMLSSLYTKLTYLCQYGTWYCLHYDPELRFEGSQQVALQEYVNSENFEKIKELFSGKALHAVTDTVQNVKEAANTARPTLDDEVLWLYEKRLPPSFAACEGFVPFLQKTKLHSVCKFYNHPLAIDEKRGVPLIKVSGQMVPFPEFTQHFTLEQGKADIAIIEKSTGRRWCYLEDGFVPHDPEKELRPFKTVDRSHEENPQYLITFNYISEGHTNSLSGIKRLREHMWLNLCTPDGKLYSAGSLSASVIRSPDLYEFLPFKTQSVTFPISKKDFDRLLREIRKKQKGDDDSFNFVSHNCSSFCAQTASTVLPNLSPKTELGVYNTLESRIKSFVIAKELAQQVCHNRAPIKEALAAQPIENAGALAFAFLNQVKPLLGDDVTYREFVKIFSIYAQDERYLKTFDLVVYQFQSSLLQDSQEEIQSKLFNLFSDLFDASKNITIDTPAILFTQLQKLKTP